MTRPVNPASVTEPSVTELSVTKPSVADLVTQLARTDLQPGPDVDPLFTQLVDQALRMPAHHPVLRDARLLAEIHRLCAEGEANLEAAWSGRIAAEPGLLRAFPYASNYRDLARAEYPVLRTSRPRHLVFAGCGPLPLTAVEFARLDPGLRMTCLDSDPAAVRSARRVLAALGLVSSITVLDADARSYDYGAADVVLVAALVGGSHWRKRELVEAIAPLLNPGAVLAMRSVPPDGRQLLYPRLVLSSLGPAVQVIGEWLPPTHVINSLVLLRPATDCRSS